MNNFERYSNREGDIIKKWIDNNKWLSDILVSYKPANTGLHDYQLELNNGDEVIIEIKEEEHNWYSKTGNIGLDFISVFYYKNDSIKKYYIDNNLWVRKRTIDDFISKIDVEKYGKLITCDAHIQLFYCEDEKKNSVLIKAYSNQKLKEHSFIEYLKDNYDLRINNKEKYNLKDEWESAAFFVKPSDERLKQCEINSYSDLSKIFIKKV